MMTSELSTAQSLLSSRIHGVLKQYEAPLLHLQRLLVWENILQSATFVIFVHFLFWYMCFRSNHIIGIFFSFVLILVWIDVWKHKIWPEIRAVSPDADAEWGELNPQLLSVKEMCDILASFSINVSVYFQFLLQIRRDNPRKFFLHACFGCICTMYLGMKLHGAFIMYLALLGSLVWPIVWYHKLLEKSYRFLEPFLMQLQYTLQQRPCNAYQLAQSISKDQSSKLILDADNSIDEFIPALDEKTAAVLAKAITDDSELSEADEEILSHGLPTFSHASTPSEDDKEELPLGFPSHYAYGQSNSSNVSPTSNNEVASISSSVIADAVGAAVKDTFHSISHTMNQFNLYQEKTPSGSASSTPVSDYEFVVLENDEEDK